MDHPRPRGAAKVNDKRQSLWKLQLRLCALSHQRGVQTILETQTIRVLPVDQTLGRTLEQDRRQVFALDKRAAAVPVPDLSD